MKTFDLFLLIIFPYKATILGTPPPLMPPLPEADEMNIKELEMVVFPDRQIPEVFWYESTLEYSIAEQDEKAPLIFVIAGTGARYDSAKNTDMQKAFNFKKVLMINPPVSLYESATKLDKMLDENIPGGGEKFNDFYNGLINKISNTLKYGESVTLSPEFLYMAFDQVLPTDQEAKAVIGFSFRIAAINLFFVSDVMTDAGFIVPKNMMPTKTTSTIDYGKAAARSGGFGYYAENVLFPAIQKKHPELTLDQMIYETSLRSIEDYLRTAQKVGMLTNVDDCILADGDIDYFKDVFASRAKIYPRGGHCGNMAYTEIKEMR